MSFIEIFDTWNGLEFCDSSLWFVVWAKTRWWNVGCCRLPRNSQFHIVYQYVACVHSHFQAETDLFRYDYANGGNVSGGGSRHCGMGWSFHTGLHLSNAYCALSVCGIAHSISSFPVLFCLALLCSSLLGISLSVCVLAHFQLNDLNNEQQKMLSKAIKSTRATFDVHFFDPLSFLSTFLFQ